MLQSTCKLLLGQDKNVVLDPLSDQSISKNKIKKKIKNKKKIKGRECTQFWSDWVFFHLVLRKIVENASKL